MSDHPKDNSMFKIVGVVVVIAALGAAGILLNSSYSTAKPNPIISIGKWGAVPTDLFNETVTESNVTYSWQARIVSIQVLYNQSSELYNQTYIRFSPPAPKNISTVQIHEHRSDISIGKPIQVSFTDIIQNRVVRNIKDGSTFYTEQKISESLTNNLTLLDEP
ncbi:MAG: hypothetical protein HYY22_07755 [Thaumarchaeota archaeon]|nr:hypothetical protein [Nitrososphaerota archaeon]